MKIGTTVEVMKHVAGGLPIGSVGTVVQGRFDGGGTGKYISVAVDWPVEGHEARYPFLLYEHELKVLAEFFVEEEDEDEDNAEPFVLWNEEEDDEEDLGHEDCVECGTAEEDKLTGDDLGPFEIQHGHPRFNQLLDEFKKLHSDKNFDYARGGDPLGNFIRVAIQLGITPAEYAHHLMMKQVDAVTWSYLQGGEYKVEGKIAKLRDIAIYATLQIIMLEEEDDGDGY